MRLALALALVVAGCGGPPEEETDGGMDGAEERPPDEVLAEKGLQLRNCPALDPIGGVYAVRFETVDTVRGDDLDPQVQRVTRFGVAQLCTEQRDVAVEMRVCDWSFGPVVHGNSNTCAAEVPTLKLFSLLPVVRFSGEIDPSGGAVTLTGWSERWGLDDGATLPAEPEGVDQYTADQARADGVLDQEKDGEVGVTLVGNGEVPTRTFVARITTADFQLTVNRLDLSGATTSGTEQVVLGGPATRLIRGLERVGGEGNAGFLRADGLNGSVDIGIGDGVVHCSEVYDWIDPPLAPPEDGGCELPLGEDGEPRSLYVSGR